MGIEKWLEYGFHAGALACIYLGYRLLQNAYRTKVERNEENFDHKMTLFDRKVKSAYIFLAISICVFAVGAYIELSDRDRAGDAVQETVLRVTPSLKDIDVKPPDISVDGINKTLDENAAVSMPLQGVKSIMFSVDPLKDKLRELQNQSMKDKMDYESRINRLERVNNALADDSLKGGS